MILGIDHVIVAVDELDDAMKGWRKLGFQVLRGGEHPQFGTHNALVPLTDGFYFELMAIKDPNLVDRFPVTMRLHEVLSSENRYLGFAIDSDDLSGDVNMIRERGLAVHKTPPGERVRPDGLRVAWRTAHPEDSRLPFLIQDQTPREVRIPAPTHGIGQDLRVACVEVAAQDPVSLRENYGKLLNVAVGNERIPLIRGGIRVVLTTSSDRIDTVALRTSDQGSVTHEWQVQQIPFREESLLNYGRVLTPTGVGGVRLLVTKG